MKFGSGVILLKLITLSSFNWNRGLKQAFCAITWTFCAHLKVM